MGLARKNQTTASSKIRHSYFTKSSTCIKYKPYKKQHLSKKKEENKTILLFIYDVGVGPLNTDWVINYMFW